MPKSAQDSPTELLAHLVDCIQQQDDTLALLTEMLAKQNKLSATKERYTPRGIPLPKVSDIPRFEGPLGDADRALTHLRWLQQVLRTHGLLTPSDDEEVEGRRCVTVIELANNSIECAGLVGWVEQDGRRMEADGIMTWEMWSAAFKAKAMPSNWEFCESRALFCLSFHEVSSEGWKKIDNAVILHCAHLLGSKLYPTDQQLTSFYCAACPERLFLCLVDLPEFHVNDLDALSRPTNQVSSDNVQLPHSMSYYHDHSHALPYYLSPAGHHICEVFRKENRCYDCRKTGHQHSKCPTHTRALTPKVNQLETELMAGDATSAYLTLAQTVPPADDDTCDTMYALFHPLLSISVPVSADSRLSAPSPKFLLGMGVSTTFVDPRLATRLGWEVKKGLVRMQVRLAGGLAGPLVTDMVAGSFSLGGRMYRVDGVLMDLQGTYDGILGLNFFTWHGLLAESNSSIRLLEAGSVNLSVLGLQKLVSFADTRPNLSQTRAAAESDSLTDVLRKLQTEFHDVFCDDLGDMRNFPTISKTKSGVRFEINLKHGATPHRSPPYRVPEALLPRFREMLLEHLNAGRLRYSSSPWASPAFLVSKGNGKFRMVCDFRALNNVTVPDMYPMGNVQDILHRAARKGKIFAKLDCKDAFFQTLMKEEDIPKTAITTPLSLLEWVVMPQGIRNAPAAQQRRINEALQGLTGECCEAYVDDIIIWGKDAKDLHDNISKLFLDEVAFLGHIICPGQILPDPAKIAHVEQFPLLVNSHQLHSFLGLVNYLRNFVPNLADHTAVLHATLPPNAAAEKAYYKAVKMHKGHLPEGWTGWRWSFGPAEKAAFKATRHAVSTVPCLAVIDYDAVKAGKQQVFLFTDASNTGTGAWIGVGTSRESAQPVAYDSRTFNSAQRNYPVHDRELLAIINALDHWRPLLYGIPVHVYCDHFTLQWFLGQRNLSPRQLRWLSTLKDFDLRIEYIKGEFNTLADYLSRHAPLDAAEPADPSLDQSPVSVHATMTYEPTTMFQVKFEAHTRLCFGDGGEISHVT
ncbi:hypothetical protein CNBF1680 [Cryptococcus deneoformans B-3501A]|uniref:hypothetical protein n=1 Tax=Cryptococcus deneoformans (strain B-3501A) TaxID=283643 RepID=UPI0000430202|nr:hypothetical protein CNBF1680 [Cryptococcus neoformans var. neoformans B-3501A]EAL20358.1 hypothetical protein CNBF1680 [Cryptococcus neoformans var. neoformans B-3501A]